MSIIHPATVIVCGGSGSGKTVLTLRMLQHHREVFANLPARPRILWCYGVDQPVFANNANNQEIVFVSGIVSESTLKKSKPDILVVDDLLQEQSKTGLMQSLFIKLSHHCNITVIYITQNLFDKTQVVLKRNAHYIILMRSPSDKSQVSILGRQLFPRRKQLLEHFHESYDDATKDPFGYLFIDVSPTSDEKQKLKTNIIPTRSQKEVIVYICEQ